MSVANLLVVPLVPVIGQLVDGVGTRRVIQAGNVVQGLAFLGYPLAGSATAVGVLVGAASLGRTMSWGANGPMITQITRLGEREQWFGFVQAMRNAGMGPVACSPRSRCRSGPPRRTTPSCLANDAGQRVTNSAEESVPAA